MTARIFKYPLRLEQREMIYMPKGAKILSVVMQEGIPVLYALVDEKLAPVPRIIRVVTTGDEFNPWGCHFIGTIQAGNPTWFIAHVFEQRAATNDPRDDRWAEDFKQIQEELQT